MTGRSPLQVPPDATREELFGGALRAWQPRRGYRFSVDAMLLAMAAFDIPSEDVLDLGTGVGIVLLTLALDPARRRLVGIEIQPPLAAFARANVALNRLGDRVEIVEGDLKSPPDSLARERFGLVVSNPPYYPVSEGLLNPNEQRAIARHELACRLDDVLRRARSSVRPDGRVLLVYPATRAAQLLKQAPAAGLAAITSRLIRSRPGYPPRQVLMELRPLAENEPFPAVQQTPTLDLHDERGRTTGPLAEFHERIEGLAGGDRS